MNRSLRAFGLALILVGASACGAGSGNTTGDGEPVRKGDTSYPVTVTDCGGRQTTYDKAPERVFVLADQAAEMLVALGLGDRIVGVTRFIPDDKTWPKHRAEITKLPVVGGPVDYPSPEQVVATSPDLVIGIAQSGFRDPLPTRDAWKQFGANAFLTAGTCDQEGGTSALDNFDYLYRDLRAFGQIFGISQRAEAIIAEMRARVAAATAKAAGKPQLSMWNYAGEETPLVAGAASVPHAIMTLAEVRNVFGDVTEAYAEVSFEQVVDRNPDAIWIMPDSGASMGFIDEASGIEAKLLSDPRVANLTAVKNKAFVTLSFNAAGVAGPQNIDALESMVDQLDKIR